MLWLYDSTFKHVVFIFALFGFEIHIFALFLTLKKNVPEGPRDIVDVSRARFLLLLVLWFGSGVGICRFEAAPVPCEQLLVVVCVQVCRLLSWFEGRRAVTKDIEPIWNEKIY